MKTKTRNILIIIGVILLIFAGTAGYAGYKIYSFFSGIGISREIPDELKEAKVLKGADFLTKTEFFKLKQEGFLTTTGKGSQIEDEKERQKFINSQSAKTIYNFADIKVFGYEIIAAGQFGGYVFDLHGNLKREILFEPTVEKIKIGYYEQDHFQFNLDNLTIVPLEKNKFGFSSFDSVQGVTIFDDNGNQVWTYGKEKLELSKIWQDEKEREKDYEKSTHILEAAVGDLDGDGVSEYIVARKSDGIRAFDRDGNERWFEKDDFPSARLTVIDIDGDGVNELLEIGGKSKIRDANGKIIRELKGGTSTGAMLFNVDSKTNRKLFIFCNTLDNKLICEDENKNPFLSGEAPRSDVPRKNPKKIEVPGHPEMNVTDGAENVYKPQAVWVNFQKDKRFLAVAGSFIGIPRAQFYVYDAEGTLVYHELLPEDAETIAVLGAADGKQEILVGGKSTIWKFSAK